MRILRSDRYLLPSPRASHPPPHPTPPSPQYRDQDLSQSVVAQLEPRGAVGAGSFYALVCERTVINLQKPTIVLQNGPRCFVVLLPDKFLEIHLSDDEDTVDADELDLFEQLLRDNVELRVRGAKQPKGRVPVPLTDQGRPLEDGLGDVVGNEIRSAAHFLAKRILEHRGAVVDACRDASTPILRAVPECAPGNELRMQQTTIDALRRAHLVCINASKSVVDNKKLLRGVGTQIAAVVGDEFHEAAPVARLLQHRGVREARRVLLAVFDASDELYGSLRKLPEEMLMALVDAMLDVVGHVWGDRAAAGGKHSLGMLAMFLHTKMQAEYLFPSSLATTGLKTVAQTVCDNPSHRALEHIDNKRVKTATEHKRRAQLLKQLGKAPHE